MGPVRAVAGNVVAAIVLGIVVVVIVRANVPKLASPPAAEGLDPSRTTTSRQGLQRTIDSMQDRLRHRPTARRLRVRAELLAAGGPELWNEFMAELRTIHLGEPAPQRNGGPSVTERLAEAYAAALR